MSKERLDVVIVGDLAFNEDRIVTDDQPIVVQTSYGGSAYYCAVGASTQQGEAGVVATVGPDFNLSRLTNRGIDIDGVTVVPEEKTARFILTQYPNNTRDFAEERGVARNLHTESFPTTYLTAQYIHLATGPPEHHLIWVETLNRRISEATTLSADTFEAFAKNHPQETSRVLQAVGMIFINEEEFRILRQFGTVSFSVPTILKKGPAGAVYIAGNQTIEIPAPPVEVVETTGAGDVLAGVFLALRAQGVPVEQALKKAVNVASQSVTEFGVEHLNPI